MLADVIRREAPLPRPIRASDDATLASRGNNQKSERWDLLSQRPLLDGYHRGWTRKLGMKFPITTDASQEDHLDVEAEIMLKEVAAVVAGIVGIAAAAVVDDSLHRIQCS